jgi:hypothetical protein
MSFFQKKSAKIEKIAKKILKKCQKNGKKWQKIDKNR